MPDRTQVGDLSGPVALQPAATPVDTYHSPIVQRARPVNAQIMDLAQALQDVQPSLQRFNDKSMQMSMEEGRALAAKNKLQFKEAVDKGIIKPGQNPWLAKGYKEQILSLQAQDYDSKLRQAWTAQGIGDKDDPDAFKKFVQGFDQGYIPNIDLKSDSTFGQVFAPAMVRSQANLLDQHTQYQQERIVQKATDATYRNIQSKIDNHYLFADDEHLGADIKQTVDGMVASGLPGAKANQLTVDAITNKAIQSGDLTVLDLLKHVQTNAGPLAKTQYAQDKIREATQHIFTLQREKDAAEWTNHERNQKLIGEDIMRQAYTRLTDNPNADITDLVKQAAFADPEKAKTIQEYKDFTLTQGNKSYTDRPAYAQLYQHIYAGTATTSEVLALYNKKGMTDEQLTYAFRDMDQAAHHRDILDNPSINRVVSEAASTITRGNTYHDHDVDVQALDAQNLIRQGLIDWRNKNPNASVPEAYEEAVRLQKIVLSGIPDNEKIGNSLPPNTAGRVQQEIGTTPKPAAAPAEAKPTTRPLYSSVADLNAAITELNTNGGTGRLAIQAEALGMSVPEFIADQRAKLPKKK